MDTCFSFYNRLASSKTLNKTLSCWGYRKTVSLICYRWEYKLVPHLWKSATALKSLMLVPLYPAVWLLGIYPTKILLHGIENLNPRIFTAKLCLITKDWSKPINTSPSIKDWLNKWGYICIKEYYEVSKKDTVVLAVWYDVLLSAQSEGQSRKHISYLLGKWYVYP